MKPPTLPNDINPRWLEFFRRVRAEARRLDALEQQRSTQAPTQEP